MNIKEQTEHQISTRELNSNRYKRKDTTKQNSNGVNKNKEINK